MILMNDIIDEYHENIRQKSEPVDFPLSPENQAILDSLLEYVENSVDEQKAETYGLRESVGIAAPQINILKQLCVISAENEDGTTVQHQFINPKIIRHANFLTYLPAGEGCLSVNRIIEGIVPRYEKITVKNHRIDGSPYNLTFEGYLAIVVQHEIDHLNGILFMDRINPNNPMVPPPNSIPLGSNEAHSVEDK
ncbi:MAG: peptide deformylase [Culicoidibacterales bacterium]